MLDVYEKAYDFDMTVNAIAEKKLHSSRRSCKISALNNFLERSSKILNVYLARIEQGEVIINVFRQTNHC